MFKPKQKQSTTKPKCSKSISLASIDTYFEKTKSSHFEIYLNSGVNEFDLQNGFKTCVSVQRCEEFLDSLVKGFSSIYQMDYKQFQCKDKVQAIIKIAKELVKIIDKLKQEVRALDQRKVTIEGLQIQIEQITQKYSQLQLKYNQLLYSEITTKNTLQLYEKAKERLSDLENQSSKFGQREKELLFLKNQNKSFFSSNSQLKTQIELLTKENFQLKSHLTKIIDSSYRPQTLVQVALSLDSQKSESSEVNQFHTQSPIFRDKSTFQTKVILDPTLASAIVSYLPPKSLASLFSLTKSIRFFLLHTPVAIQSSFRSIIGYKEYEISFFHRHIFHFQEQMKKIPQEIIQSTFYQFNILKQNVGGDFMVILNLCANIFEGKFNPQTSQIMTKTIKQYVESKEIVHFVESPNEQEFFLRVDKELISHFFEQRKVNKQKIMKEIEQMTQKIFLAQNLYSVDSETLQQFHQNIVRHFTILFILAKHLFSESRNLQYLNQFLLSELNQITKLKIQKQYDLEDIKAELEASNKMCLFLSDKCTKSEERILRLTKEHLETQRHVGKLAEIIKSEQEKVKNLQSTISQKDLEINRIREKYNELKNIYTNSKEKYNRLVNELAGLKQTIFNIN